MKKSFPQLFFLLLVLLITTAFFGLVADFFLAIFWAIVFAILFHNRFEKLKSYMPQSPNMAAGLTVSMIILIVIVPLVIIGSAVYFESSEFVENLTESNTTLEEKVDKLQDQIPLNNKQLRKLGITTKDIEEKLNEFKANGAEFVAGKAIEFTQNFFGLTLNFFVLLYVLFFFLRDGKRLVQELIWVLPMKDQKEMTLLRRFESVARATVKGSLLVAFVQGTIGGILFWCLGIPAAFLWGVIMVLTSLLPTGSILVWGPWALSFFFQGDITRGIILVIVGAGLIGVIDNFLRPRLVGKDTKMSDYLVLLSTLGGLSWFGLSGFVLGPIIAALFTTCWFMLGKEYGNPYEEVVTEPTVEETITEDTSSEE